MATKTFNIGGGNFNNPTGRENKEETNPQNDLEDLELRVTNNENEIIRLDNEKANLVDVADVQVALSDQKFIESSNNVFELTISEDTSGFVDGKLTQLKMVLGDDTIRFNDSFNDASGEGRIVVIDGRRITVDKVIISSTSVRVEGNFANKTNLFIQYEAKFLSQA